MKLLLEPVVTVLPGAGVVLQSAAVTVTRSPCWEIVAVSVERDRWLADKLKVSVHGVPTVVGDGDRRGEVVVPLLPGHYAR